MTFAQFQASGRGVTELATVIQDEYVDGPGRVYCKDCLFIQDATVWPTDAPGYGKGRWYTLIGREEYQSDDLEEIERVLYGFAESEGYTC